jgi:hypothetical protein
MKILTEKKYLTVPKFAEHIGKSPKWVKLRIAEGKLLHLKGKHPLVREDAMKIWQEKEQREFYNGK